MGIKLIDFDISSINYKDYKYGVNDREVKAELKKISEGFCMYCYDKISHNAHQEHYVDKSVHPKFKDYKYNIVYSCPICNSSKHKNEFRDNFKEIHKKVKVDGCATCNNTRDIKQCYQECAAMYRVKNGIFNPLLHKCSKLFEICLYSRRFMVINRSGDESIKEYIEKDRGRHISVFGLDNRIGSIIDSVCEDILEHNKIPSFKARSYENLMSKSVIEYFKAIEQESGLNEVIELLTIMKYTH